ncbi:unnamed protein product [Rhizoctonia solani]|uniref:Uncharacterized protein n=1 Tax=Rhizoctonia solani TaxID=456999 RepID=A0A8H2X1D0_9AGAM|nr:unnamed protein product [Rhizoctonia solani]
MTSEESFTHVSPPSSSGHGSTQNPRSPSLGAPNTRGVKYVRVGRGIVPVPLYDNRTTKGRNAAVDLVTTSVYGTGGEASSEGTPKQKWYKQAFSRTRHLSFQGALSRRSTTSSSEAELPAVSAPTRLNPNAQNDAGRRLRSRSQSPLPPTPVSRDQPINRPNLASTTPPPRMAHSMYVRSPGAHDEDGRLLLGLLGINEDPSTSPPATEQTQPHRLPTPEPEPEPEQEPEQEQPCVPPARRLPPVPVLNVVPPHDSQDAFAYVFGPARRSLYMEHRGLTAPPPPPYIARQSAILDRYKVVTPEVPISPEPKRVVLPPVAPLTIRRKGKTQGETGC